MPQAFVGKVVDRQDSCFTSQHPSSKLQPCIRAPTQLHSKSSSLFQRRRPVRSRRNLAVARKVCRLVAVLQLSDAPQICNKCTCIYAWMYNYNRLTDDRWHICTQVTTELQEVGTALHRPDYNNDSSPSPAPRKQSEASTEDVLIELRDVHKSFGSKKILRGVNIKIRRGEAVGIIGGSGTGKSTTLRLMAGLLAPDKVRGA